MDRDGLYQTAGCIPLLQAASQGAKDTVQMLLNAGCYIDVQDEDGNSAIHEASWNGFSQTAELLVKYNCNVCLMNKAGFTALHLAAQNGHNECSRVLLYAGCNPDIKNNYGDTALHTAARYGHAGVARILISARCKISEQNKNGDTALHIAAALKRRKIAKILVESGIETELANKQNETAADVAKRKEYPEILHIITSYSKSKPSPSHQLSDEQVGVTLKKAINSNIRSEVYQENEPLHKHEPEVDKQQKERRFFFFKKKNKKTATPLPVCGYKKPDAKHSCTGHEKPAVQGFFSHYVPQDGVQFYRDLAGNIKQGPIGYAPVCQCGPSLRRLEKNITDTRQSLQKHITASHHLLSQQIDNLDSLTNQQGYASEVLIKDKLQNACNARITERLQEERQKSQAKCNEAHASMKEELEYWLDDRLASYGHCLDHHHDDSALPPRNLFFDFAATGRLIRSKSDETLSASDYSGKFRKKDFYTSRRAAMQHIRSWDVAAFDSFSNFDISRRKERNNNSIANSRKVVTHAQVHTKENVQNIENDNFITASGNLTTHVSNTEKTGTVGRSEKLPWKQTTFKTTPEKDYISKGSSRVTFSKNQQNQHLEQSHHHSLSSSHSQGSPHNPTDHINLNRQKFQQPTRVTNPTSQNNMGHHTAPIGQHSYWTQQNLHEGGPPNIDTKLSELDDSRILLLTGQDNMHNNKNTRFVDGNQKLIHSEDKHDARTISADTLLNEESNMSYSRTIRQCQSMENGIDRDSAITSAYNSGYLTDIALRQSSAVSSTQIIGNNQNMHSSAQKPSTSSCATYRNHLTETSISQNDSQFGFHRASSANSPQQGNNTSFRQAKNQGQSPTHCNKFNKTVDPFNRRMVFPKFNHASREFIQPTSLHKSVDNLDNKNTDTSESEFSNSDKLNQVAYPENYDFLSKPNRSFMPSEAHSVHFPLPKNSCLQNENVNSGTRTSPAYVLRNKEDSTCSSNQDSGYGSRNHGQGLKRGIDIGGGTPSSSFSAEQSGCNTPSNADSSYVHCELSNEKMRTSTSNYHNAAATVYDNGFHFSPDVVPNNNIHSNSGGSRIYVSYEGSNYDKYNSECRDMSNVNSNFIVPSNGDLPLRDVIDSTCQGSSFCDKSLNVPPLLMSSKPIVHDLSNYNSSWYSYAVCDSNTHILAGKQLQSDAFQDTVENSTGHRSGKYMDITEKVSSQQSAPNNHSFSFKGVTKPSKNLREQVDTALLTCSSDTSLLNQTKLAQTTINNNSCDNTSEVKANSRRQNSDSMSQVAIQAHIQGWYQRKLMEAAHRLKQNHSYSQRNPEQYLLKNNNCYQGKNVANEVHDFNVHLSNSEKSQDDMFPMCIPTTNFQIQNSSMCQFQNSTNKNSYTEHQQSDSLKNSRQAGVTQHTRVIPLYDRNFSSSSNASHLLPVDKTYRMKTEESSAYTSDKQLVTYSSLFYDSVRGSDV
ncbi:hypothetical protein BsWGS_12661 [Bradybaena similaris]